MAGETRPPPRECLEALRRTWIWGPYLSDEERARALETSRWLVEALPPSEASWWENVRKQIKGHERPAEDISELKETVGADLIKRGECYQAFRVNLKKWFLDRVSRLRTFDSPPG